MELPANMARIPTITYDRGTLKLKGFVAIAPVAIQPHQNAIKGIALPTLAIWGSNDRIIPPQQADLLVQLMPNAEKVILLNAGHACYMKATDEFHHHLLKFIAKITNVTNE